MTHPHDRGTDLSKYNEAYKKATIKGGQLPPGDYTGFLSRWKIITETVRDPILGLWFTVDDSEDYDGRTIYLSHSFAEDRIDFLKTTIFALGFDPLPLPDELEDHLDDKIGHRFLLKLVRKGQYTNVYINDQLGPAPSTRTTSASTNDGQGHAEHDDDIPF